MIKEKMENKEKLDEKELKELIEKGESESLEFKKSTSELKEAVISIVSILNKHQKGELLFGVKNNGEVVGQVIGRETIRSVSQSISNNIEPKIFPKIEKVIIKGKGCIYVGFSGDDRPYYAYGRAYTRVGDEDRRLSVKEVEKMILEKNKEKLRWDIEICREAKLRDISSTKLKKFLKKAELKYDSLENSLKKLNLLSEKKLLNSAVILFGKSPEKFFQNAKLRCAVFATNNTTIPVDMQEFRGDLFYLIEKAEEYILKNIHIGMRLEGLYRVDVPEIDKEAFREAIINAFCHRDYYQYDSVNIAIFKDRLEIRSPGLLYGGLTIEKIKTEEVSERRNELIAEMFHKVHFVEKWGRGISLILTKEPTADFKEVGRQFISVFKRKGVEGVTEKVTEKVTYGVTENQSKILTEISKNKFITTKKLSSAVGISERKIKENIAKLKQKGLLRRVGSAKGGYWEIIEK